MPRHSMNVSVCARCGTRACSGELWEYISITEHPKDPKFDRPGILVDMDIALDAWDRRMYRDEFDSAHRGNLNGFSVGDEVTLRFSNWAPPSIAIVRKIED